MGWGNISVLKVFHECDDMQIILMTSDTVATQSHTVITALIVLGYDTDAFFTVCV